MKEHEIQVPLYTTSYGKSCSVIQLRVLECKSFTTAGTVVPSWQPFGRSKEDMKPMT